MPTDARPGPLPAKLTALSSAVRAAFDRVGGNDWRGAATATRRLRQAWDAYRSDGVPDQLVAQMRRDIDTLAGAVAARGPTEARAAALRVAQNDLDLQLRHRPVVEIDLARLRLWARQLQVDTAANDPGAVAGDVTTMEWIRDRVRHTLDQATAARVDEQLRDLRAAADNHDVPAAAKAAPALLKTLAAA